MKVFSGADGCFCQAKAYTAAKNKQHTDGKSDGWVRGPTERDQVLFC